MTIITRVTRALLLAAVGAAVNDENVASGALPASPLPPDTGADKRAAIRSLAKDPGFQTIASRIVADKLSRRLLRPRKAINNKKSRKSKPRQRLDWSAHKSECSRAMFRGLYRMSKQDFDALFDLIQGELPWPESVQARRNEARLIPKELRKP